MVEKAKPPSAIDSGTGTLGGRPMIKVAGASHNIPPVAPVPIHSPQGQSEANGDPLIGAVVAGSGADKYKIIKAIGKGGMGKVYLATNQHDDKVAIKFILEERLDAIAKEKGRNAEEARDTAKEMFYREAILAGSLAHKNITRTFDVGSYGENVFYVMEYVEGMDLDDKNEEYEKKPVSEHWGWLGRIIAQVCDGLYVAHTHVEMSKDTPESEPTPKPKPIMHRDLTPDNLRITVQDGEEVVKIMDFGIAKAEGDDGMTRTGIVKGKLHYYAPEYILARQRKRESYDYRVDIWALGVMMYYLLSGRHPYDVDNEFALVDALKKEPSDPRSIRPDIPPAVAELIMRCLQRDPDKRYQNVMQVKRDVFKTLGLEYKSEGTDSDSIDLPPSLMDYMANEMAKDDTKSKRVLLEMEE